MELGNLGRQPRPYLLCCKKPRTPKKDKGPATVSDNMALPSWQLSHAEVHLKA